MQRIEPARAQPSAVRIRAQRRILPHMRQALTVPSLFYLKPLCRVPFAMVGNAENRTGEGAALGCSYSSAAKNFAAHAASPYRPHAFFLFAPIRVPFFVGGECRESSRCGVSRSCDAIGDLLSYSALLFSASIAIPSLTLLTCSARSAELCAATASPYRLLLSEIPVLLCRRVFSTSCIPSSSAG